MEDKIPQSATDAIAQHINQRNNKQYNIPIVGNPANPETPQIFEIIPLEDIDAKNIRVYAIYRVSYLPEQIQFLKPSDFGAITGAWRMVTFRLSA